VSEAQPIRESVGRAFITFPTTDAPILLLNREIKLALSLFPVTIDAEADWITPFDEL
jgi:hypothetical protein